MLGALTSQSQPLAARLAVIPPSATTDDFGGLALRDRLLLEEVHFVHDKSDITPTAIAILDRLAESMRTHSEVCFEIAGRADSVGSFAYNTMLSARRARAVRDHLIQRGVPENQMTVVSDGGLEIAPQATLQGRDLNRRRVELRVRNGVAQDKPEARNPHDAERRATHAHLLRLHPKI